jgi:DNA-binding NarL/FixJ family response regulator
MPFAQGVVGVDLWAGVAPGRAAVERLQAAHDRFAALGARPFVERCERELSASGLAPAKRHAFDSSRLTAQELAVAQLVARGRSNRQVASELFVSVKTVQFHLTRIYSKLRSSFRVELVTTYAGEPEAQADNGQVGERPRSGREGAFHSPRGRPWS